MRDHFHFALDLLGHDIARAQLQLCRSTSRARIVGAPDVELFVVVPAWNSEDRLEARVRGTIARSLALEEFWNAPVTASALAEETQRIAANTGMPLRLLEFYRALDESAFLVQECLVRPALVRRLISGRVAVESGNPERFEDWWTANEPRLGFGRIPALDAIESALPKPLPANDTWTPMSVIGAPSPRRLQGMVWTGNEMLVWGGYDDLSVPTPLRTGGVYDPVTDSWSTTSLSGAPSATIEPAVAWTGSEMVVWNPQHFFGVAGRRYDPFTDTWNGMSAAGGPSFRYEPSTVWTGSELIVWGGYDEHSILADGAAYDPQSDRWRRLSEIGAPEARCGHVAVWSGDRMVVWGGKEAGAWLQTGSRYDPVADRWDRTTEVAVPGGVLYGTAVWTGQLMLVWGGLGPGGLFSNTGGRYEPGSDAWVPLRPGPPGRLLHSAVWTGHEMLVWGGWSVLERGAADGGRYDPLRNVWRNLPSAGAPTGRVYHRALWTGESMIVWGGTRGAGTSGDPLLMFNSGAMFHAAFRTSAGTIDR